METCPSLIFCIMILFIFLQILIAVMDLQYNYFLIIEYRLIEVSRFWYFQDKDKALIFLLCGNENYLFLR